MFKREPYLGLCQIFIAFTNSNYVKRKMSNLNFGCSRENSFFFLLIFIKDHATTKKRRTIGIVWDALL